MGAQGVVSETPRRNTRDHGGRLIPEKDRGRVPSPGAGGEMEEVGVEPQSHKWPWNSDA